MRYRKLAVLLGVAAVLGLYPGSAQPIARAHTTGGVVSFFHCLDDEDGQATVDAGSWVTIRQGWGSQVLGDQNTFLNVQTTIVSVKDEPMVDISDQWTAPAKTGTIWASSVEYPTNERLTLAGDQMRFTFALVFSREFTEQFNREPGGAVTPIVHEAGLAFGGTCTVTAE